MLNVKKALTKILDALKADYVVEKGTDGNWTYRKWNSGRYEAKYYGGFSLNAGSAWVGGYYHETAYGLALPSFARDWHLVSAVKSDATLMFCVGARTLTDGLHLTWVNGGAAAVSGTALGYATVVIEGTWK